MKNDRRTVPVIAIPKRLSTNDKNYNDYEQ